VNKETHHVVVQLIGYEYRFVCQPSEQEELLEAARYLNERMGEIRDHGKQLSLEAIAVMTALNLSHDLLRQQRQATDAEAIIGHQVRDLLQKVDAVL
jgi:cell division protein ZapA